MTVAAANRLRTDVDTLSTLAVADLRLVVPSGTSLAGLRAAVDEVLGPLLLGYAGAASTLAADWYDDLRADQAATAEPFTARMPDLDDLGVDALAGWAFNEAVDADTVYPLLAGGMQRRIADAARQTVIGSTLADPAADGWQRVAGGSACGFCRMLADRGAVYSEASVDFGAHDHCGCGAVPAWGGVPRPVEGYKPSSDRRSDEVKARDRARAYAWMRDHGYLT